METSVVGDISGVKASWEVIHFVGDGVPLAERFFGGSIRTGSARVALFDQRVEIYHFSVGVEGCENGFSRYACGEGREGDVSASFRHGDVGCQQTAS